MSCGPHPAPPLFGKIQCCWNTAVPIPSVTSGCLLTATAELRSACNKTIWPTNWERFLSGPLQKFANTWVGWILGENSVFRKWWLSLSLFLLKLTHRSWSTLTPSTEGLVQFRLQVVYPSVLILKPHTKETRTVGHVLGLRYSQCHEGSNLMELVPSFRGNCSHSD